MRSYRLFRVAGIDIGIHPSWIVVFVLVTWSLAVGYFPTAARASMPTYWLLGAVASILLFASVLVHELAHSLVARREGLEARSITLFIFGGVSNLTTESPRPSVEFLVAIVGPLSSLGLAGVALVVANLVPADSPAQALFLYLGLVNALLAGFNLIPGFPLDGGRVLRAIVWRVTGSLRRATEIAASVGTIVAAGLLIWGVFRTINGEVIGGLWIAAIGWFLQAAASAVVRQVRLQEALHGISVGAVVEPDGTMVPPNLSVADVVDGHLLPTNRRAVPVGHDGAVDGIVTVGDIRRVPPERRAVTQVGDVMGGRNGVVSVTPETSLADALTTLGSRDLEQVPVLDDGHLIGMLSRADVMRQFELREDLGVESSDGTSEAADRPAEVGEGRLIGH